MSLFCLPQNTKGLRLHLVNGKEKSKEKLRRLNKESGTWDRGRKMLLRWSYITGKRF